MNSTSVLCLSLLPLTWSAPALAQEAKIPRPLPVTVDTKVAPPVSQSAQATAAVLPRPVHVPDARKPLAGENGWHGVIDTQRVHWDASNAGTLWARAEGYKASFDASGATYIPFLGSDAPQNYPVHFRLSSIRAGGEALGFDAEALPVRQGESVVYERGLLREVYQMSADGVEQTFVFDQHAFSGDLVVRLALDSELSPGSDAQGLVFGNELGGMRYSSAVTFDAHGTRAAAPTSWKDGEIEIVVPASTLASAHGALTIDPFLGNYAITGTSADDLSPDVAWDETSQRQMVVLERIFSATDHDVYWFLLDVNGGATGFSDYLDFTSTNVAHPRVANNGLANNFLCVTQHGLVAGASRDIYGRLVTNAGTMGSPFLIQNSGSDLLNPVVGGDNLLVGPTYYFVAFELDFASGDRDIYGRLIASDGTLMGSTMVTIENSGGTFDQEPVISKTDGGAPSSGQDWTIVWSRTTGLIGFDLFGARVHWDGVITNPTFPIDTTSAITFSPSVSSPLDDATRTVLLSYTRALTLGSDPTIVVRALGGVSTIDAIDLVDAVGGLTGQMQLQSACDSDGRDFTVAWTELSGSSTSDTDVYESTVVLTGHQLSVAGVYQTVFATPLIEEQIRLCSTRSATGTPRRAILVARGSTGGQGDIYGARMTSDPFAAFCFPGSGQTIACPCGNAPLGATLGCNNSANSGGGWMAGQGDPDADSVSITGAGMKPNATCVFLQGALSNSVGVSFGDGVRCASGQLMRLSVKTVNSSGNRGYPEAGDPSIKTRCQTLGAPIGFGEKRAYQVYYRDPANYGCSGAATFNITSALQVQW
ncbi:MAG: hypothetical protein IPJ19_04480 [Planctomycetes bacterium]|nr:hypothetical protein [Planctomycetota bacterium]